MTMTNNYGNNITGKCNKKQNDKPVVTRARNTLGTWFAYQKTIAFTSHILLTCWCRPDRLQ